MSLSADDTLLYQTIDLAEDAATFHRNIDAIHHWSVTWTMPLNETKCHVISFGNQIYRPGYKLGGTALQGLQLGTRKKPNGRTAEHTS